MKNRRTITPQRVLQELAAIGFARVTDLVAVEDGKPVLKNPGKKAAAAAIAGIEPAPGGIKVKFYDKMQALELLTKLLGPPGQGAQPAQQSELLQALLESVREAVTNDDIPELQQAAANRDDLVEPPEIRGL